MKNILKAKRLALALAGAALLLVAAPARAQPPQQWALLIGVQKYDHAAVRPLQYATRDVALLRKTLVERAGVPEGNILELSEEPKRQRPTLANLRRELKKFLGQVGAKDRVILFFSGHGYLHNEQTFLIPADCDPRSLEKTALSATEVYDALRQCPAATKFLILDSCHAGGAGARNTASVPTQELAKAMRVEEVPGCVVLASCTKNEVSYEWDEREHGVFTYWLCRALEGGAEADDKGQVAFEAVYRYVEERVRRTTEGKEFRQGRQSPVRMIGTDSPGTLVVLTLRPESMESLCRRLAEHVDLELRARQLKRVGVLEFSTPVGAKAQEALVAANLPGLLADKVRGSLAGLGTKSGYSVLDEDRLRGLIRGFSLGDLGDRDAMQKLGKGGEGLDCLVVGSYRRRNLTWHIQCELIDTKEGNSLVKPNGVLPMTEDLLGSSGTSFSNRDRPVGAPHAPAVVDHVRDQANRPNPVLSTEFPFPVKIWSVTQQKYKEFATIPGDNALWIAARKDEIYEIHIWNNSPTSVAVPVLVDGFNTIGQKREGLDEAWFWVVPGKEVKKVTGWSRTARDGKAGTEEVVKGGRFQFTDVSKSVAGRHQFGDAIGLITVAIYAEAGRGLGTGEGPEETRKIQYVDFKRGRLQAVVNIRYLDESEYKRLVSGR